EHRWPKVERHKWAGSGFCRGANVRAQPRGDRETGREGSEKEAQKEEEMKDDIEFYASTVAEAVEKAALELGLTSAEVPYRVLDEGNSGFLGIGARDARIVVEAPVQHSVGEEDELPDTTRAENVVVGEPESEPSDSGV